MTRRKQAERAKRDDALVRELSPGGNFMTGAHALDITRNHLQ